MSGSTGSSLIIPKFVTIWIIIASILVTWDAAFVLSRPHSMAGGHLFWLFQPYAKYISVDLLYGNMKNSFVVAQAWLNIFEILGGVLSLIIYHGSKSANKQNFACLLLLVTCVATFWKTVLYFSHDFLDVAIHPDQHPKDITWFDYIFFFALPGYMWIIMPFFGIVNFMKQILAACGNVRPNGKVQSNGKAKTH